MALEGKAKVDYQRRYMRERRANEARQRSLALAEPTLLDVPLPDDPAQAIIDWCPEHLRVPTGRLMSAPFSLDDWQADWLRGALAPGIMEAGLSVARKNGKSGLIAAMLLGYLTGPMAQPAWRAVVCSLTGPLAKELRDAIEATAFASGLGDAIQIFRSPPPGRIVGRFGSRCDFLAADKATGHAIGADMAIIDEAGLLPELKRGLWDAMLSSVSGRDGRMLCISIRGDGPMFGELAERADADGVFFREWAAPIDADFEDRDAWHAANPGLASGIKSEAYMAQMAARAKAVPMSASNFAAYDLNQPQEPGRQLILTVRQWLACCSEFPAREGPCFVGVDLGGSTSMTAAATYWPATGRIEFMAAFPGEPDLDKRGDADGVGGVYLRMHRTGELMLTPGSVTDVAVFLEALRNNLEGQRVKGLGLDRHRREEAFTVMGKIGWRPSIVFRGLGAGTFADGAADVRAFQTAALTGEVNSKRSLLMEHAIEGSALSIDKLGNPSLDKARSRARIDVLQAAVIAVGLGKRWSDARKGRKKGVYHGAA